MTGSAPVMARWNRFSGVSRPAAAAVLALLAALMLFGLTSRASGDQVTPAGPDAMRAAGMVGDHALYARIVHRVEAGEPYYAAVAAEHRANHYPLKPFVTVRLPTLATIFSAIGLQGGTLLVTATGIAAILTWRRRLMTEPDLPAYARFAALLIAFNLSQIVVREWVLIHEVLAGVLITLALALYRPARPWAAMAVLAIAVAIRETVLPVAMLLGCFALLDRNWRAVGAWLAFGLSFLVILALHMSAVAAVTTPADLASPGWNGFGGWASYLSFVHFTSGFRFLPAWVAALLVPLALLGWAAWRSRLAIAVLSIQLAFALLLMLFARSNNFYWAMLVVPTLFVGLVFAPAALTALLRALKPSGLPFPRQPSKAGRPPP